MVKHFLRNDSSYALFIRSLHKWQRNLHVFNVEVKSKLIGYNDEQNKTHDFDSFYLHGNLGRDSASTVEVCTLNGDSIQCVEQYPPYR